MSAHGTPNPATPDPVRASPAAVAAVQEALGCERFEFSADLKWCELHETDSHQANWTDRGCAKAVAAADAAAPHNAATALEGFLQEGRTLRPCGCSIFRNALMCCVTSAPAKTEVRLVGPWIEVDQ